MSDLRITLALLTRNRPDCLRNALTAACAGSSLPDEVLVSDDSNEDQTELTLAVVRDFPKIRYTKGPRKGLGANENHLVREATGDWIVFNGDDACLANDFIANLRCWLAENESKLAVPSGYEILNGQKVQPNALDFFGYQRVRYQDYEAGRCLKTFVVQATAFPMRAMRQLQWLEVSIYGYDEVDMAHKLRKLGYEIVYEPRLWLYHNQADEGRIDYPLPTQIARIYVMMRIYGTYEPNLLKLLTFTFTAPFQLAFAFIRRGMWSRLAEVGMSTFKAYSAFAKSRRKRWQLS